MPEQAQAGDLQTAGAPETPPSSTDALAASTPRGDTDTPAPLDVIPVPEKPEPLPKAARTPPDNGIAEVIVTAQRLEQRAQDVPISFTVITPLQMSNANISYSVVLASSTPSLSFNTRFLIYLPSFSFLFFS